MHFPFSTSLGSIRCYCLCCYFDWCRRRAVTASCICTTTTAVVVSSDSAATIAAYLSALIATAYALASADIFAFSSLDNGRSPIRWPNHIVIDTVSIAVISAHHYGYQWNYATNRCKNYTDNTTFPLSMPCITRQANTSTVSLYYFQNFCKSDYLRYPTVSRIYNNPQLSWCS